MFYENVILAAYLVLPPACVAAIYRLYVRGKRYQRPAGRTGRIVACNLLVLVLVAGCVLLIGEIYYRFIYDTTESYAVARTTREWFERHVQLNNVGVRDSLAVYNLKRTPGKRRITVLGDSFTVGHGIANVEDRFANLIRHARPQWEVHIFAKNGLDTGGHLRYSSRFAHGQYEVDVVLLAYCLNDISDINDSWRSKMRAAIGESQPPAIVMHSYVINTWYYRLLSVRNPYLGGYYDFVTDAYRSELWHAQKSRLAALHQDVKDAGARLAVVTFPFMHTIGADNDFGEVHEALDAFWQAQGVEHLDLKGIYEPFKAEQLVVNTYDAHPNELAHRLAADAIIPWLDRVVQTP